MTGRHGGASDEDVRALVAGMNAVLPMPLNVDGVRAPGGGPRVLSTR